MRKTLLLASLITLTGTVVQGFPMEGKGLAAVFSCTMPAEDLSQPLTSMTGLSFGTVVTIAEKT
jgi:hypothetical protein